MPVKESSSGLSTLAAQILKLGEVCEPVEAILYNGLLEAAKALAGSVLSQDETPEEALPD